MTSPKPANAFQALAQCLAALRDLGPRPSHKGACGPEAGCDADCMDAASFGQLFEQARAELDAANELLRVAESHFTFAELNEAIAACLPKGQTR